MLHRTIPGASAAGAAEEFTVARETVVAAGAQIRVVDHEGSRRDTQDHLAASKSSLGRQPTAAAAWLAGEKQS
jgi:hypothetical protein